MQKSRKNKANKVVENKKKGKKLIFFPRANLPADEGRKNTTGEEGNL